jgi:hypothetical protein
MAQGLAEFGNEHWSSFLSNDESVVNQVAIERQKV